MEGPSLGHQEPLSNNIQAPFWAIIVYLPAKYVTKLFNNFEIEIVYCIFYRVPNIRERSWYQMKYSSETFYMKG